MRTFITPTPISATVDIIFGDITFVATDRTDTVVEVSPVDPAYELDVKAAEQAVVEFTSGRLIVKHPKLRTLWSTKYGTVAVRVALPTGSDIQAKTANGGYVVNGPVGAVQLKTPNGDTQVERATGDLRVNAANGDITIGTAQAGIDARTASGDVRVHEIGTGAVDLYTATGQVELTVPDGVAIDLDARSTVGRVISQARTGQGVKVRARTHGGNITVHQKRVGEEGIEPPTSSL
ncbi:DUF4097 family beta strand repeat-containing protein [Kribbella sp. NPDC026611]|uniref:DUF4097 family beta strand repeat-containing protein n=1 Tax=Kribbella sp. NPDC026611 TaxID=3154911 RepID=UPI003411BD14